MEHLAVKDYGTLANALFAAARPACPAPASHRP